MLSGDCNGRLTLVSSILKEGEPEVREESERSSRSALVVSRVISVPKQGNPNPDLLHHLTPRAVHGDTNLPRAALRSVGGDEELT